MGPRAASPSSERHGRTASLDRLVANTLSVYRLMPRRSLVEGRANPGYASSVSRSGAMCSRISATSPRSWAYRTASSSAKRSELSPDMLSLTPIVRTLRPALAGLGSYNRPKAIDRGRIGDLYGIYDHQALGEMGAGEMGSGTQAAKSSAVVRRLGR